MQNRTALWFGEAQTIAALHRRCLPWLLAAAPLGAPLAAACGRGPGHRLDTLRPWATGCAALGFGWIEHGGGKVHTLKGRGTCEASDG